MIASLLAVLTLVACGGTPTPPPAADAPASADGAPAPAPAPELHLPNGKVISPSLVVGGQPSPMDLEAAKAMGITTVVDLRSEAEPRGFDEAGTVERLGMTYVTIPIGNPMDLSPEAARRLDAALAQGPALVHCASGNRVGGLFAIRAKELQGMDAAAALALGKEHGLTSMAPAVEGLLQAQ